VETSLVEIPLESDIPLETSVSLEDEIVHTLPQTRVAAPPPQSAPVTPQPASPPVSSSSELPSDRTPTTNRLEQRLPAINQGVIPLLEERLVIDRTRRKIGEVIVRKEIETSVIEVPIRREKIIVEQINPEHKQILAVDLGEDILPEKAISGPPSQALVSGEFPSVEAAMQCLAEIAKHPEFSSQKIRLSVTPRTEAAQLYYQKQFEHYLRG
jgi:hypothetical protein